MRLQATVRPLADQTQILVTDDGEDRLRAVLPAQPLHPRALGTLLEGLALWCARPVDAVLVVDRASASSFVDTFLGGGLLPGDLANVRFDIRARRRPRRLRGPGDFRVLYVRHGESR